MDSHDHTPPGPFDKRILMALRRIIRAVELHSRKLASTFRITAPQLVCMMALREEQPMSTTALARSVHLSPSTVVGIADRLEEKGLLCRERSRSDRRVVNLSLSEEGASLLEKAPSPLQDRFASALDELDELEQTTIALSLERIVELMEAGEIEAAPMLETGPLDASEAIEAEKQGPE